MPSLAKTQSLTRQTPNRSRQNSLIEPQCVQIIGQADIEKHKHKHSEPQHSVEQSRKASLQLAIRRHTQTDGSPTGGDANFSLPSMDVASEAFTGNNPP